MKYTSIKSGSLTLRTGICALASLLAVNVLAQNQPADSTMIRTVVVEQEYNPNIKDATKINVLPKVADPTVTPNAVQYDTSISPLGNIPSGTMPAFTGTERQDKPRVGFLRFGYGNNGNLETRANYLFLLSDRDRLNLGASVNGMNGKLTLPDSDTKWDSRYYRTRAGVDYSHMFNAVNLDLGGHFGLSNFNYLPSTLLDRQKFMSGDVHIGLQTTDEAFPLQFRGEVNYLYYQRQDFGPDKKMKENIVRTKADVTGAITEEQLVGIGFEMNNVFYDIEGFDNYTSLELNPYYEWKNDSWRFHAGAHVDLATGHGKKLRVAPDVTLEGVFADKYVFYIRGTGGKMLNDFRRLEELAPYNSLYGQIAEDSYEQYNASLGLKASPAPGVWFNVYGGYQDVKDDLYQSLRVVYPDPDPLANSIITNMLGFDVSDTRNLYVGGQLTYGYKGLLNVSASAKYQSWKADKEIALVFKPAITGELVVDVKPIHELGVQLGYRYVGRDKVQGTKMDAVSNLFAGANYQLLDNVSVYVKGDNLLNQKYQYHFLYPTQGINVVGGVSLRF